MHTVADYLQASYRLSGILGENDSVSAEQGAAGLEVFNDLILQWRGKGLDLGVPPSAGTTENVYIPEDHRMDFKYLLAIYLCAAYGKEPYPWVAALAASADQRFMRLAAIAESLENNAAMPLGEGHFDGVDFNTLQ